jgi:dethiobiotin synthetase
MPKKIETRGEIIFVTGTDTGVGKTLLTGMLLHHLRADGKRALAMKPFCSGRLGDVSLFQQIQGAELSREEINPFYFRESVAPLVAVRKHRHRISLGDVLERIRSIRERCEYLLVEGAGGLMVPLGEKFSVADLISRLDCYVLVVGRNQLGVINHTRLTLNGLAVCQFKGVKVVLMGNATPDSAAASNVRMLRELTTPTVVVEVPFLGIGMGGVEGLSRKCKKIKKTLAAISDFDTFRPLFKKAVTSRLAEKAVDSPR